MMKLKKIIVILTLIRNNYIIARVRSKRKTLPGSIHYAKLY